MVRLKSEREITLLREGGAILAEILARLATLVAPGVTPQALDATARDLLRSRQVEPSFLNYAPRGHKPFPAALCVSVNHAVVHGLPTATPLHSGDLVKLDLGLVYHGLYLDSARTVPVGKVSPEADRLMEVTRRCLARGIAAARVGNTIGDIGAAVQACAEQAGFGVVRQLVGHGVGHAVHEEPAVPNFGRAGTGAALKTGLVIAIEPMITIGDSDIETASDGWTVVTKTGNLAAHEEHTVAVTKTGPRILTAGLTDASRS